VPDIDHAVAAIHKRSAECRRELLLELIDHADHDERDLSALSLDRLEALYEVHYEEIWSAGGLSDDNARHDADEYHNGYQAALAFALQALREAGFRIPQATFEPRPSSASATA